MGDETRFSTTYDRQEDVRAAVRYIRGTRHSWRREHLLVELGKIFVYIVPVLLLFAGMIDKLSVIMFVVGVFTWRGYERYLLPMITRMVWSNRAALRNFPGRLFIDDCGVKTVSPDITVRHSWQSVSDVERYDRGVLIRVGPQWVYPFLATSLPAGVDLDGFLGRIGAWRGVGA